MALARSSPAPMRLRGGRRSGSDKFGMATLMIPARLGHYGYINFVLITSFLGKGFQSYWNIVVESTRSNPQDSVKLSSTNRKVNLGFFERNLS
ncbi:hypothetical protein Scep_016974 [Stephania cephalantha]|uniref:Uncharacterized protein n=1 Tax=Stephania cephalantha TaxID=152367 RepID=A0AAP0INQ4_9MAGN